MDPAAEQDRAAAGVEPTQALQYAGEYARLPGKYVVLQWTAMRGRFNGVHQTDTCDLVVWQASLVTDVILDRHQCFLACCTLEQWMRP